MNNDLFKRKGDLISWTYALEIEDLDYLKEDDYRCFWLANRVARFLELLEDFAIVRDASIWTESEGEDAFTIDNWKSGSKFLLGYKLLDLIDTTYVDFTLDLHCLTPEPLAIPGAGNLCFFIELDEEGNLRTEHSNPVWLSLTLDVDIYFRELSKFNKDRLYNFLNRLEEGLPSKLLDIEDSWDCIKKEINV
jgi:hypothetical protein